MKKLNLISSTLIILFASVNVFGQPEQKLSEQLWERAQSCYSNFEDTDGDGKLDNTVITDDSNNGYLKVSGLVGTCGCSCSKAIAAFRGKNGNYTFLEQETGDCSWLHKVSSDRRLSDILPNDLTIKSFIPSLKDTLSKEAVFYLDFDIPQYGTRMEVTLKIIPFGMNIKNDSLLVYGISQDDKNANLQETYITQRVVQALSSEGINLILNNQPEKLSRQDADLIATILGEKNKKLKLDTFADDLRKLKKIYDLYTSIEHKAVLLKWDRNNEKFHVQIMAEAVEPITFEKFLRSKDILRYWGATC